MARRTIPMIEVEEILYQWLKGMSERKIARSLGISRNTVKTILRQGKKVGLTKAFSTADLADIMVPLFELRQKNERIPGSAQTYLAAHHEQITTWLSMPYMTVTHKMEEHTSELQSIMRISYAVF